MGTLIQWQPTRQGGWQVAIDSNLAVNRALLLMLGDIATERQSPRDLGISLSDDIQGDYSIQAQVHDPNGDQVS